MTTQTPAVPTASDLAGLNPAVAVALILLIALLYLGPEIRSRLKKADPPKSDTAKPADTPGQPPAVLPAAQAIDRTSEITDRYIATLTAQLAGKDDVIERQDREIARLNDLIQREQWRRGSA